MEEKKEKQLLDMGTIISAIIAIIGLLTGHITILCAFAILMVYFLIFRNDTLRTNFRKSSKIKKIAIISCMVIYLCITILEMEGIISDLSGWISIIVLIILIVAFLQWLKKEENY